MVPSPSPSPAMGGSIGVEVKVSLELVGWMMGVFDHRECFVSNIIRFLRFVTGGRAPPPASI